MSDNETGSKPKIVYTPKAPMPAGHYSQAIIYDGLVYVSGQLPIDPETGAEKFGTIEDQAEQVLSNIGEILLAAGSDLNHVIKTTAYITDIELWPRVNASYAAVFGEYRPARAVVPTKELHYGFLIEIDAVAAVIK
ncbi:MAG: RidA family protein [Planctomycetes bacterium]|nr:RidA family protein [Planctomycetota bacterium]